MAISNVVTFRGLKKSLNTNNHNNSDFGLFFSFFVKNTKRLFFLISFYLCS